MHSDAMSTPPVLVEMIYNEIKRGHADRLNGLWNLSCSSAILDPAILSELVKNGFYINQCYSMTELAGYGLLNVPRRATTCVPWASRTASVRSRWTRPARSASAAAA